MCANFSFTGQKCLDPSFNQSCRTEKQSIIVSFFFLILNSLFTLTTAPFLNQVKIQLTGLWEAQLVSSRNNFYRYFGDFSFWEDIGVFLPSWVMFIKMMM